MNTRSLPVLDDAADRRLFGQADLLLWLSDMLATPEPLARGTLEPDVLRQLFEHAGLADPAALAARLQTAASQCASVPADIWSSEYERLFGPELQCPIYETAYVRRDKGAVLGDVAGFYRAFGFTSRGAERPDHLCAELELTAMLCLSLMRARGAGDLQASEVVMDALTAFTSDHLGEWLPSFAQTLQQRAELPLYVALGELLQLTAAGLGCAAPSDAGAAEASEHGTPYECGMAAPAAD